jgi:hypothetical protein
MALTDEQKKKKVMGIDVNTPKDITPFADLPEAPANIPTPSANIQTKNISPTDNLMSANGENLVADTRVSNNKTNVMTPIVNSPGQRYDPNNQQPGQGFIRDSNGKSVVISGNNMYSGDVNSRDVVPPENTSNDNSNRYIRNQPDIRNPAPPTTSLTLMEPDTSGVRTKLIGPEEAAKMKLGWKARLSLNNQILQNQGQLGAQTIHSSGVNNTALAHTAGIDASNATNLAYQQNSENSPTVQANAEAINQSNSLFPQRQHILNNEISTADQIYANSIKKLREQMNVPTGTLDASKAIEDAYSKKKKPLMSVR